MRIGRLSILIPGRHLKSYTERALLMQSALAIFYLITLKIFLKAAKLRPQSIKSNFTRAILSLQRLNIAKSIRVLDDSLICELAEKYKKQPAQICLRYAYQMGVMPLPKSSETSRMKENMDVFDFEISQEDMFRLQSMPPAGWSGLHPDR